MDLEMYYNVFLNILTWIPNINGKWSQKCDFKNASLIEIK